MGSGTLAGVCHQKVNKLSFCGTVFFTSLHLKSRTMRAVVQRVKRCRVTVDGNSAGQIGPGLLVLLGVSKEDTDAAADYLAVKLTGLRIFEDDGGKLNLSVEDNRGELLVFSEF